MKKLNVMESNYTDSTSNRDDIRDLINLVPFPIINNDLLMAKGAEPQSVTILPTYRCNAACKECCFESNISIKHRMNKEDLLALIRRIKIELPSVRFVVFSGGEVTLIGDDLFEAISLLTELHLGSRIVTNGHWGRSNKSAEWWINRFISSGLRELNISTGDEHQEWVPFDSVARAAYHAVKNGLLTLIVNEGKDTSRFNLEQIKSHPLISEILHSSTLSKNLILLKNVWIPFHSDADITNKKAMEQRKYKGCDNIFENFVVNPYGNLMSCCGLTMEYIPEMKIGHIDDTASLHSIYVKQYGDLLKLWIWLDGTRFIFENAISRSGLDISMTSPHQCSICVQIYQHPKLRSVIMDMIEENAEQIIFRAAIKTRIMGNSHR